MSVRASLEEFHQHCQAFAKANIVALAGEVKYMQEGVLLTTDGKLREFADSIRTTLNIGFGQSMAIAQKYINDACYNFILIVDQKQKEMRNEKSNLDRPDAGADASPPPADRSPGVEQGSGPQAGGEAGDQREEVQRLEATPDAEEGGAGNPA